MFGAFTTIVITRLDVQPGDKAGVAALSLWIPAFAGMTLAA